MSAQIHSIIVYSIDGRRRGLKLRLNDVNIITGKSRTGKTALLDIIDYCLGRTACNIPAGPIRSRVGWYALILQLPDGQAFIARRAPGPSATTSPDIVLEFGKHITPPSASELNPNINLPGLISALGRLIGLTPNENIPISGQTRHPLKATIDHAKFLIFQGQSEIANRNLLFHRQGEQFIPQAIRDTLPYFLGSVPDDSLMLRARLRDAKQELLRLQRQKSESERISGEGFERASKLLAESTEVGLTPPTSTNPLDQLRSLLEKGVPSQRASPTPEFGNESDRIKNELAQHRRKYQEINEQIRAASEFNSAQTTFEQEVESQKTRLEVVGLFPEGAETTDVCPVCESTLDSHVPSTLDLDKSLRKLRAELSGVGSRRPRVDEYINGLRGELQEVRQRMQTARRQLESIETQNRQLALAANLEQRQALVIGRISLYLENVPQSTPTTDLDQRIKALESEVSDLEGQISSDAVREAVDSALNRIGQWMTEGAQELDLEYQPNPHRLDISQLTVTADTDIRPIRMNQMGSAENWLGCHLITHVALHRWFATKNRPVPRFLFIDQPTSAYYPPDDPSQGTDEDRLAVSRMYKWLIDSILKSKAKFQILIVDHADLQENWFQERVIERWRGNNALIPQDWLE